MIRDRKASDESDISGDDEVDPSLIITTGRRTRGKTIDYSKALKADPLFDDDDDDD